MFSQSIAFFQGNEDSFNCFKHIEKCRDSGQECGVKFARAPMCPNVRLYSYFAVRWLICILVLPSIPSKHVFRRKDILEISIIWTEM